MCCPQLTVYPSSMALRCGSFGRQFGQIDCNILSALHNCQSSLPCLVGACNITHLNVGYVVTCRCATESSDESEVVSHKYSMAQSGGLCVIIQSSLLNKHNLLIETSYFKMTAVVIMESLCVCVKVCVLWSCQL